jgi:hypothetical protein
MISAITRAAFADELEKISGIRTELGHMMSAGWNGTKELPQKWLGEGRKIIPGMSRFGRAMEHATSLGGLTKYLPVGGKSMAIVGTGLMAPTVLAKEDPSGHGKSRLERVTGLAGNTLGGLAASGALIQHGVRRMVANPTIRPGMMHGPLGLMAAGILGGIAGERLLTTPFAAARRGLRRYPTAPMRPDDGGARNTAPGGLNTTPDAVVGQAQAM